MKILVACEFSGIVREALRAKGHDAWSCDLLPTEQPGQHIQGSVFDVLLDSWDGLIAHPPCTFLTNSGVRWLYNADGTINGDRWGKMLDAVGFFNTFIGERVSHIPMVAVENPIMHKHAREQIACAYTQIIQPWQFGHGETKATCLWLRGLPKLNPSNIVAGRVGKVHHEAPGPDRWKNRSRTYTGIAAAFAEQWFIPTGKLLKGGEE
jgi:hypothetical protein